MVNWSDFGIVVVALTPLVLGILAFIEKAFDRKKKNKEDPPEQKSGIVQGMTISSETAFARELVAEIKADRQEALDKANRLEIENQMLREQLREKDKA